MATFKAEQWLAKLIQWSGWSFPARVLLCMALTQSDDCRAKCMGFGLLHQLIVPMCNAAAIESLGKDFIGLLAAALLQPVADSQLVRGLKEFIAGVCSEETKNKVISECACAVSDCMAPKEVTPTFDLCDLLLHLGNLNTSPAHLEALFNQIAALNAFSPRQIAQMLWRAMTNYFNTSSIPEAEQKAAMERMQQYLVLENAKVSEETNLSPQDLARRLIDALQKTLPPHIGWDTIWRALDMQQITDLYSETYTALRELIEYSLKATPVENGMLSVDALEKRLLLYTCWRNNRFQIDWMTHAFLSKGEWCEDEAIAATLIRIAERPDAQTAIHSIFTRACVTTDCNEAEREFRGIRFLQFLLYNAAGTNEQFCINLISDIFERTFAKKITDGQTNANEHPAIDGAALMDFIEVFAKLSKRNEDSESFMHHTIPTDADIRWKHTLAAALLACVQKGSLSVPVLISFASKIPDSAFLTEIFTQAPAAVAFALFISTTSDQHMLAVRGWIASSFFEPQRTESYLHPASFIEHAAQWVEEHLSGMGKDEITSRCEKLHAMLGLLGSPFRTPTTLEVIEDTRRRLHEALLTAGVLDVTLIPHPVLISEDSGDGLAAQAHSYAIPLPAHKSLSPDEYERKMALQAKRESEERRMVDELAAAMFQQLFAGKCSPETFLQSLSDVKRKAARCTRDLLQEARDRRANDGTLWKRVLNQRQAKALYAHLVDLLWNECPKFVDYPASAQTIAVKVVGGAILYDLFPNAAGESKTTTALLKFVLQNIGKPRKPAAQKFTIHVLAIFLPRVPQWPQYCKHLQVLLHAQSIGRELKEAIPTIQTVLAEAETEESAEVVALTEKEWDVSTMALDRRSIANRLALLDNTTFALPSPGVRHRVAFLLNSLTAENVEKHALEITPLLETPQTALLYFARYLVEKRIVSEPNYHKSYAALLDRIGSRVFEKMVLSVSYCATHAALKTDSIRTSSSERTVLKNLGAWIGLITLSRDRPIIARELNVQGLLIEGLAKGKLIAVVPFVSKILEGSASSKVFTVQSPWVLSVFAHLVEIYSLPNIKVNIRFELEVLCKKMNINLRDIDALAAALPARAAVHSAIDETHRGLDFTASPDFTAPPPQPKATPQLKPPMPPSFDTHRQKVMMSPQKDVRHQARLPHTVIAQTERPGVPMKHDLAGAMKHNWMDNLDVIQSLIPPFRVPANISAFLKTKRITLAAGSPKLVEAVPSIIASILKLAVEVAVKEVLLPVVERSVVIATNTTRELVRKDFAFDTDDHLLETSVKTMAKSLAASLAVVTAKEPLRASTRRTLQSSIVSSFAMHSQGPVGFCTVGHDDDAKGQLPAALLHEFIDLIFQENKDGLGVLELVERVAAESATSRVADFLGSFQEERHQNRRMMQAVGRNFPAALHPFTHCLPPELRTLDGMQSAHKAIYEDFVGFSAFRGPIPRAGDKSINKILEQLHSLITHIEQEAVRHYQSCPTQYLSLTQPEFASSALSPSHETIKKCLYLVPDLVKSIGDDADVLKLVQFTYNNLVSMTNSMGNTTVSSAQIIQHINSGGNGVALPTAALILNLIHESYLLILQSAKERMAPRRHDGREEANNAVILAITQLFIDDEQCWELKDLCVGFIRLRLIDIAMLDAHVREVLVGILEAGPDGLFASGQEDSPLNYTPQTRAIFEFAGGLVQSCLVDEKITSQRELEGTLQALEAVANEAQRQQKAYLRASGQKKTVSVRVPTYFSPQTTAQRVFVWNILEDWRQHNLKWEAAKVCETSRDALKVALQSGMATGNRSLRPEEQVSRYIQKITQMCAATDNFVAADFFQLAIEASVTEFATQHGASHSETANAVTDARRALDAVDALSSLIVAINSEPGDFWKNASNDGSVFPALFAGLRTVMRANHGHFAGEMHDSPYEASSGPYPSTKDTVTQHEFQQQPYFRLLSNLLCAQQTAKTMGEHHLKSLSVHLTHFLLHSAPAALPGFTFGWISLVFHRALLPSLLRSDGVPKGSMPTSAAAIPSSWLVANDLLVTLIGFLRALLSTAHRCEESFPPHIALVYTSILRGMLVLLHDFPEFLCVFADALTTGIPKHCVQLRNVILSAFPRAIRLPDPFTPNLKVDLLPESAHVPLAYEKHASVLKSVRVGEKGSVADDSLFDVINGALQRKVKLPTAVQKIVGAWRDPSLQPKNEAIIPATVLAIARAVVEASGKETEIRQDSQNLLSALCVHLQRAERLSMLSALADQLRYPNRLTLFCSFILLSLFSNAEADAERFGGANSKRTMLSIQEQITRVLFQRLIGNRPHPWGLLITFIELVKNPRYAFWKKPYVHNSTPALRKLFESVGHSCAPHGPSEAVAPPEK